MKLRILPNRHPAANSPSTNREILEMCRTNLQTRDAGFGKATRNHLV